MGSKKYLIFLVLIIQVYKTKCDDIETSYPDYYNFTVLKKGFQYSSEINGFYERTSVKTNNFPVYQKVNTLEGNPKCFLILKQWEMVNK